MEATVRHPSPKLAAAGLGLCTALAASLFGCSPAGAGTTTVAPGSTLWGLAAEYGTTVSVLAAINGLSDPNRILVGQILQLPQSAPSAPSAPSAQSPAAGGSTVVTVSPGENLSAIAAAYGTTVPVLASANGLANPNLIEAGEQLVVPTGPGTGTSTAAPAATTATASAAGAPVVSSPGPQLSALFEQWSSAYGVPRNLLEALTWWESGWNNAEVSPTGAVGLGQLEPYTVDYIRTYVLGQQSLDPGVPSDNLQMTAAFLHLLLQATAGTEGSALAAYYQGLASVTVIGELPDTRTYVAGILAYAQVLGSK